MHTENSSAFTVCNGYFPASHARMGAGEGATDTSTGLARLKMYNVICLSFK